MASHYIEMTKYLQGARRFYIISLPFCGSDLTSHNSCTCYLHSRQPHSAPCCSLFLWQARQVVLVSLSIWLECSSIRWPRSMWPHPLFLYLKSNFFFPYLESNVLFFGLTSLYFTFSVSPSLILALKSQFPISTPLSCYT